MEGGRRVPEFLIFYDFGAHLRAVLADLRVNPKNLGSLLLLLLLVPAGMYILFSRTSYKIRHSYDLRVRVPGILLSPGISKFYEHTRT